MDLGLVVTGTSSRDEVLYQKQISFLRDFLKRQNIDNQYTRISVANNGIAPNILFSFNDGISLDQVERYANNFINPGMPSSTDVNIRRITENMFTTQNGARGRSVPKTLLLFVTKSTNVDELKTSMKTLKDSGVKVVVVAVGNDVNKPKLLSVVEDKKNVIFIGDGRTPDSLVDDASNAASYGELNQFLEYTKKKADTQKI